MFNGCVVDSEWERRVMEPLKGVGRSGSDGHRGERNGKGRKMGVFRIDVPWREQGNDWSRAPFTVGHHEPEFEGRIFGMDSESDDSDSGSEGRG